jgi:hypothetical protein
VSVAIIPTCELSRVAAWRRSVCPAHRDLWRRGTRDNSCRSDDLACGRSAQTRVRRSEPAVGVQFVSEPVVPYVAGISEPSSAFVCVTPAYAATGSLPGSPARAASNRGRNYPEYLSGGSGAEQGKRNVHSVYSGKFARRDNCSYPEFRITGNRSKRKRQGRGGEELYGGRSSARVTDSAARGAVIGSRGGARASTLHPRAGKHS